MSSLYRLSFTRKESKNASKKICGSTLVDTVSDSMENQNENDLQKTG